VLDTAELAADKNFEDRGIRQTMKHPVVGNYVMSGWPVRFGGKTPAVAAAPLLGQHGEEVLAQWLKLDKDQIGALRNDAVVA
jgi:crotonobetainyl-CoA:carnitine CoA-transferase CaiB-like acyl-CoA transferase